MKPFIDSDKEDDPIESTTTGDASDVGQPPDYDEIRKVATAKILASVEQAQLNKQQQQQLESLIDKYIDCFRLVFANEPSKLDDFKIRVKEGAVPKKVKARSYNPLAYQLLKKTVMELEANGLIRLNKNSRWAAPVLMIPKPIRPGEYRVCVDLRYINHLTIPTQWPMPDIEKIISQTAGAKYFFTGDFLQGYWQAKVHEDSQEYYSFMTPWGVSTPYTSPTRSR